jgi:riboflavin synthase
LPEKIKPHLGRGAVIPVRAGGRRDDKTHQCSLAASTGKAQREPLIMFTGIIQKTGEVVLVETAAACGRLMVRCAPWDRAYEAGESIAVNGVCLTLVDWTDGTLRFDVLQETFLRTNLGGLRPGCRVNLERALRHGDALGGHYVTGHIDGTGRVAAIISVGRDRRIDISCSSVLLALMVHKGSITCDGISLTIAELRADGFSVHLIPHTLEVTNWGGLKQGDAVNLEPDLFAKHVKRLAESGALAGRLTWQEWKSQTGADGG